MKKNILHFIESLGRGGAETMLVSAIKELKEYNNIVVTLFDDDRLGDELKCDKYICMNMRSVSYLPLAMLKFRKIVKDNKADIVHTHLVWPTLVARFATPGNIPLLSTIHTSIATAPDYKKWFIRGLDKYSYKFRRSTIIGVGQGVLNDYFSFLHLKPYKSYLLYTFVDIERFNKLASPQHGKENFEISSSGSFRVAKNFPYLINAFRGLKNENIVLHIYGSGHLQQSLQQLIDRTGVNVILKGEVRNIQDVLPRYDAYVMSSVYEGFSLAVLEAMAVKLPLMLSDIPSFREQGGDTVIYFDLNNEQDFIKKILALKNNYIEASQMAERSYRRVIENFTLQHHVTKLRQIYTETLEAQ